MTREKFDQIPNGSTLYYIEGLYTMDQTSIQTTIKGPTGVRIIGKCRVLLTQIVDERHRGKTVTTNLGEFHETWESAVREIEGNVAVYLVNCDTERTGFMPYEAEKCRDFSYATSAREKCLATELRLDVFLKQVTEGAFEIQESGLPRFLSAQEMEAKKR